MIQKNPLGCILERFPAVIRRHEVRRIVVVQRDCMHAHAAIGRIGYIRNLNAEMVHILFIFRIEVDGQNISRGFPSGPLNGRNRGFFLV